MPCAHCFILSASAVIRRLTEFTKTAHIPGNLTVKIQCGYRGWLLQFDIISADRIILGGITFILPVPDTEPGAIPLSVTVSSLRDKTSGTTGRFAYVAFGRKSDIKTKPNII